MRPDPLCSMPKAVGPISVRATASATRASAYNGEAWNNGSLDGWVIGGGIEYMWSPNWSIKAEYLYFDFGKQNHNNSGSYTYGCDCTMNWNDHYDSQLTINTFKVGLNYHFNTAYAPLK